MPFWEEFASRHWERSPAAFADLFDPPICSAAELFDAVVRTTERGPSDRFWMSTRDAPRSHADFTRPPLDLFGPRPADGSLEGFFARILRQAGSRPWGVNVHALQTSHPELWFRFRAFIGGLTRVIGALPTQRWDVDTFFGTYPVSPLGIHRDNASVFAVGIQGRRTYCFWPAEAFEKGDPALGTPDRAAFEARLPDAIQMEMGPGDVVYWPSSHWHLILSEGGPSAVVQVSAYFGRRASELLAGMVRRRIARRLGDADLSGTWPLDGGAVPAGLAEAAALVDSAGLERDLQRFWLARKTADGFDRVPDPDLDAAPAEGEALALRHPIAWMEDGDGRLRVFANGLGFTVPDGAAVRRTLEALSRSESVAASDDGAAVQDLLASLYQRRAFTKIGGNRGR